MKWDGMPGTLRKVIRGRWDSPFMLRLKRFVDLTSDEVDALQKLIESEAIVPKRRDIVVEGYPYNKLCFIKDGIAARCRVLRNGKRQIVNVLVPGDVIGLCGSFVDRSAFSVIALTEMTLEVCSYDAFVDACNRRPKFGLALAWLAVQETMLASEHIVDIGRRTPIERLAHFLLELHSRLRAVGRAAEAAFDLPISQEVMSDTLGLSVPHLNRTLASLRDDGLIILEDGHVRFTDLKALERLAHFQPATLTRIPAPAPLPREMIA